MTKKELLKKIEKVKEKINEFEVFPDDVEDEFDQYLNNQIPGLADEMKENDMKKYHTELIKFAETLDKKDTISYNDLIDELDDLEYELEEMEE